MKSQILAMFVFASVFSSTEVIAAENSTSKAKKSKTLQAPKQERSVSDSTWNAMVDRDIILTTKDREVQGRVAGHDSNYTTLITSDGTILNIAKDDITEVRAVIVKEQKSEPIKISQAKDDGLGPIGSFKRRGKFILLSPGIIAIPVDLPIMYRWGFSIGGLIPTEGKFASSYGFTFEHFTRKIRDRYTIDYGPYYQPETISYLTWIHIIRALAEFRLGGSNKRIFGYGLFGFGGSVLYTTTKYSTDGTLGLTIPLGAGVQRLIGEHFIIGIEPRMIFDLFMGSGFTMTFDPRFVFGARF